jgi:hypothetical protein
VLDTNFKTQLSGWAKPQPWTRQGADECHEWQCCQPPHPTLMGCWISLPSTRYADTSPCQTTLHRSHTPSHSNTLAATHHTVQVIDMTADPSWDLTRSPCCSSFSTHSTRQMLALTLPLSAHSVTQRSLCYSALTLSLSAHSVTQRSLCYSALTLSLSAHSATQMLAAANKGLPSCKVPPNRQPAACAVARQSMLLHPHHSRQCSNVCVHSVQRTKQLPALLLPLQLQLMQTHSHTAPGSTPP